MRVLGTGKVSLDDIYKLAGWTKKLIRQGVKYVRAWKPLNYITTGDLDQNGKLKKDYLVDRERRKKERESRGGNFF